MTEGEWSSRITDFARLLGWRFVHFRPAKTARGWRTPLEGDAGFPDLVLVRPPRLIFAELKVGRNKPNTDQRTWIDALRVSGVEVYLWYPEDWPMVLTTLRAGRRGLSEAVPASRSV